MDYPEYPGPLKKLKEWLQSWENGKNDIETHSDDEYTQDWGQPWFKEGGNVVVLQLTVGYLYSFH